jgi:hypothetical protein
LKAISRKSLATSEVICRHDDEGRTAVTGNTDGLALRRLEYLAKSGFYFQGCNNFDTDLNSYCDHNGQR